MTTYPFLIRIRLNSLSSPQDCRDAGKVVPKPLGGTRKGECLSGIASTAAGCTSYLDFDRRDSFLRGEADVLCCLLR